SGSSSRQIILSINKAHKVIALQGIDEKTEHTVTTLHKKIILPHIKNKIFTLKDLLTNNNIIIGHKTAVNYGFKIGDRVDCLVPEAGGKKKLLLKKRTAVIAGIFKIGLDEFDNNCAFTSINFLNKIFDEQGVDKISINLIKNKTSFKSLWKAHGKHVTIPFVIATTRLLAKKIINLFSQYDQEQETLLKLKKRLHHLHVNSWKDLYPALVSSLKLEKYVMFFILALITLVASMNMISLLFMQIQNKRPDIAILKTMGMQDQLIRSIFLRIGLSITIGASTLGLGLAAIAGYFLEKYPFIQLPDVYYVSHLPARMDLEIFVVVFAACLLLGLLATWIPARRAKNIEIVNVLRQQ
ncbi:MAG: FtsX-like permease family protein, partial [bacterium]